MILPIYLMEIKLRTRFHISDEKYLVFIVILMKNVKVKTLLNILTQIEKL